MSIVDNYIRIKKEIPEKVKLIVVTKTISPSVILELYNQGHRDFGENKVQELLEKYKQLPKDIRWHFIGHLQTNKVKQIVPFISLIHSVDSFKLVSVINEEAKKVDRVIDCLLQFHVASEPTKYGLSLNEGIEVLADINLPEHKNVRIIGVMGIATFTNDNKIIRKEFRNLFAYFRKLKFLYMEREPYFKEISMGMSEDYKIAIAEGSTMVRIGSAIFGPRIYN
jgi:hypothetical protein